MVTGSAEAAFHPFFFTVVERVKIDKAKLANTV